MRPYIHHIHSTIQTTPSNTTNNQSLKSNIPLLTPQLFPMDNSNGYQQPTKKPLLMQQPPKEALTLNSIAHILKQVDLVSYLNTPTLKQFNKTSRVIFSSLVEHIERSYSFVQAGYDLNSNKMTHTKVGGGGVSEDMMVYRYARKIRLCAKKGKIMTIEGRITHLNLLCDTLVQPLHTLPQTLTHLTLDILSPFDVEKLPPLVSHLALLGTFNNPLYNLPTTLTHLRLGREYFHCLDYLPSSIIHLALGRVGPVDHLPSKVKHLLLTSSCYYFKRDLDYLPSTITRLSLGHNSHFDHLPSSVKHLEFGTHFNMNVDHLPPALITLKFGKAFNKHVDYLPPLITHLTFGNDFNKSVNHLPQTLKHLHLGNYFNQSVDYLPSGIICLTTGLRFNQSTDNLPPTLRRLLLGDEYNQPVDHLPPTVRRLALGRYFNRPIDHLPRSLEKMCVGYNFRQGCCRLPTTLVYFKQHRLQYDANSLFIVCEVCKL